MKNHEALFKKEGLTEFALAKLAIEFLYGRAGYKISKSALLRILDIPATRYKHLISTTAITDELRERIIKYFFPGGSEQYEALVLKGELSNNLSIHSEKALKSLAVLLSKEEEKAKEDEKKELKRRLKELED